MGVELWPLTIFVRIKSRNKSLAVNMGPSGKSGPNAGTHFARVTDMLYRTVSSSEYYWPLLRNIILRNT